MPRPSRSTRTMLAVSIAAAALLGLSACGSNGVTEEAGEHSVIDGVNGEIGAVAIRNANLTLGVDGGALLAVAFVNASTEPDTLTGISSPEATSFVFPDDPGYVNAYGNPSNNPGDDATGGAATSTPTPSGTAVTTTPTGAGVASTPAASASAASTSAAAATTVGTATLPSQVGVFYGQDLDWIEVTGLTGDPRIGSSVPVTFMFRGAGIVTLQVPVVGEPTTGFTFSPAPAVTAANNAGEPAGG